MLLCQYRSAFEDAIDQRSRVHFAAASAVAQANDDLTDTRRQAATLHNAVLDSQRRNDKMREKIEKSKQVTCTQIDPLSLVTTCAYVLDINFTFFEISRVKKIG